MKWSVPVIVLALSACILFGSIGFSETTRDVTVYTNVLTDIAPLADADPVQDTVNYNPLTNVTGWGSSVGYTTQSAASLYMLQTDYTYTNHTSNAVKSYGHYLTQPYVSGGYLIWKWDDGSDVGNTAPDGKLLGGWAGTYSNNVYEGGSLVGTEYAIAPLIADVYDHADDTYIDYHYVLNLDASVVSNRTIITLSPWNNSGMFALWSYGSNSYSYTYTFEESGGLLYSYERVNWGTITYTDVEDTTDYYYQNGLWYKISGYDNTAPIIDFGTSYRIAFLTDDPDDTFSYKTISDAVTTYITPYTLATVSSGSATWSNGYQNVRLQFIADAKDLYYSVNQSVTPTVPLTTLSPDMSAWATGYTGKILVTIDGETGTAYWQGVTAYSDTQTFTVAEYRYELIDPDHSLHLTDSAGSALTKLYIYYLNSSTGDVGVVNTWMAQDSNGVLWQDATFPINTAFSTLWANDNLRVSFNSFVVTGTGITVNGTTYPIDGQGFITIVADGVTKTFKFAGSSIEWTPDGDTTLIAPNGDRYDLGTRSGTFTLNGVWYGAMGLDTFEVRSELTTEPSFGQHAEDSWRSWVFVGVLTLGVIAVLATGRQLDSMDLLILVLAGAVGIVMAVML